MPTNTTNVNGETYAHHHVTIVFSPNAGPKAGQQFTWKTFESFDFSRKRKSKHQKGNAVDPNAVVRGQPEPEWSGECSALEWDSFEDWDRSWGSHTFTITVTTRMPGRPSVPRKLVNATLDDDSFSSKTDDGAKMKIGGICTQILRKGVNPLADPTLSSGNGGGFSGSGVA